jgi:hypothetical protein
MKLDEKGRCCGRKPLVYRGSNPHRFCTRCDRAYHATENEQLENWAWKRNVRGEFERKTL